MLRQRDRRPEAKHAPPSPSSHGTATGMDSNQDDPRRPLLPADAALTRLSSADDTTAAHKTAVQQNAASSANENAADMENLSRKSQWIVLAVASGTCAAFNGVFAKLTTTDLTATFATSIANLLGLKSGEKVVEVIIRGIFFLLNLLFNGIMWALFTKALKRGTSTTQVSIVNTSSNFMITAILGFIIFSESLPPLWWLGAAMLVAGNVIIGRREEEESNADGAAEAVNGRPGSSGEEERGELLGGHAVELRDGLHGDAEVTRQKKSDEEDILHLDDD